MELIVDGKAVTLNPPLRDNERIAETIHRIGENAISEHRLITGVTLDGSPVPAPDDPALNLLKISDVRRMEVTTEPSRKVAIRVLYDSGRHIPRICESLVQVAERIQSRNTNEAMSILTECLTAWGDVNQGIESACATVGVGYSDVHLHERKGEEVSRELVLLLHKVEDLMVRQDYFPLADLLEFELEPKLREIQELIYLIIGVAERSLH